jgi:cobyrinic acid a,c-diamide synthase
MMKGMYGFVVGASHSSSGKSTVVLGLLAALKRRQYKVQPFKAGPDFIDPGLHRAVTGTVSYNLDRWMCGDAYVKGLFQNKASRADVTLVEGVMGLFDGANASTAEIAKLLGLPVVLVMDVKTMAETAAAVIRGMLSYDRKLKIAGVILNRVGSQRHLRMVKDAIQKHCKLPVFGYLPVDEKIGIPERHLGLYTAEEGILDEALLKRLVDLVETFIDIESILNRCFIEISSEETGSTFISSSTNRPAAKLAIAKDRAFCFYYEDNIEMLKAAGIECLFFSPLQDRKLPEGIDGLYLGGGYPELYAGQLSANEQMRRSIKEFVDNGGVVYAECGGFMYLMEGIFDSEGNFYPMVGVYPMKARMRTHRFSLGYREIILKENTLLGNKEDILRGHEFHYSEIAEISSSVSDVYIPEGGFIIKNCLGSYIHIHFGSNGNIIKTLTAKLKREEKHR